MEPSSNEQQGNGRASIVWIVAVLLVMAAWAGAFALRGSGEKEVIPGWADGMPAGLALAEDADKPMVLLFTAGWCGPCQSLKKNELANNDVHNALMAGYVPVQIDLTDQSPRNPNMEVAQRYGIEFLPTVVVTTPEGDVIEKHIGKHTAPWFSRLAE